MAIFDFLIRFLPAMFANATPVVLGRIPYWSKPINIELFGSHKTWKGLILGILAALFFTLVINAILNISNYPITLDLVMSLRLGVGVLIGDLIKSYFKRRLKIKEGKDWIPFDQIDWTMGAYIFSYPLFTFYEFLALMLIASILHVLTNKFAEIVKLK